jgi:hypothetical protein
MQKTIIYCDICKKEIPYACTKHLELISIDKEKDASVIDRYDDICEECCNSIKIHIESLKPE